MWLHLLNQKKGLLSCRPWGIHCPWAEAIWLQVSSSLNSSRWKGSHSVLPKEKKTNTITVLVGRKSHENPINLWCYGSEVVQSWRFSFNCSLETWFEKSMKLFYRFNWDSSNHKFSKMNLTFESMSTTNTGYQAQISVVSVLFRKERHKELAEKTATPKTCSRKDTFK